MLPKWLLIVLVAISGSVTSYATIEGPVVPPLLRPAIMSRRITESVLLSVTRAGSRLVAVGEHGYIIYSDDEGVTWQQASVPVAVTIIRAYFVSAQVGWAVGHQGVVLHTEDGGKTWVKQLDGVKAANIALSKAKQRFSKANNKKEPRILYMMKYAKGLVVDGPDKPFFDVYFKNEKDGFVIGAFNMIFKTKDGGETWEPWMDHVDNRAGYHLYAIGSDGSRLFIAGEQGLFLRSDDGGTTFYKLPTPYSGSYFGLSVLKDKEVLIYGLRGNAYLTKDAGFNWVEVRTGVRLSIMDAIECDDGTILMVSQSGEVLKFRNNLRTIEKVHVTEHYPFCGVEKVPKGILVVGFGGIELLPVK